MSEEDAYIALANAIVLEATAHWRRLCKKQAPNDMFTELRQFFKSDWCATLCGTVEPLYILKELEREREIALNEI